MGAIPKCSSKPLLLAIVLASGCGARSSILSSLGDGGFFDVARDLAGAGDYGRDTPVDESQPGSEPSAPGCSYTCSADLTTGANSCQGVVQRLELAGRMALFVADLQRCAALRVTAPICAPKSWVLNIGNSPTNNGFGGDSGDFSNDSELQIRESRLTVYSNDYGIAAGVPTTLLDDPGFLPVDRRWPCREAVLAISDGKLEAGGGVISSPYLFRINQPDGEGQPDALLYVALNRVVASTSRSGSGAESVRFERW